MRCAILIALSIAAAAGEGPCDIYTVAGTPCVAAHSTVRALYGAYNGSLYQVMRTIDKAKKDIPVLTAGGFANSIVQDEFCADSPCTINRIYDQSPQKNHLDTAPGGGACRKSDVGCNASAEKLIVGGHHVYAAHFRNGNGYRNDKTSGIAKGDEPETMYMITAGRYFNGRCCFDYGNAETNNLDDGPGTMEAVYFGSAKGGMNHGGAGKGPWIMADIENALWGADIVKSNEPPINHDFVTAMVKGDASKHVGVPSAYTEGVDYPMNDIAPCGKEGCTLPKNSTHLDCESKCTAALGCIGYVFADESCSGKAGPICWTKSSMDGNAQVSCRSARVLGGISGHWAIKGGDAQAGKLSVYWDGPRAPRYAPMKKQGSIILGVGGDNSCSAIGTFYEGVMTKGYTTDAADDAVQANIVAAGYRSLSSNTPIFM